LFILLSGKVTRFSSAAVGGAHFRGWQPRPQIQSG